MFRHILVPTDGSPHSTRAARLAIRLARSARGKITALHVVPPFVPVAYVEGMVPYAELYSEKEYKRLTHAQAARMIARIERMAAASKVRCETAIVDSDSEWKAILAAARSRRCDAIAMGTHGRTGLGAVLLGSVAAKVLTHSTKPVLVCR